MSQQPTVKQTWRVRQFCSAQDRCSDSIQAVTVLMEQPCHPKREELSLQCMSESAATRDRESICCGQLPPPVSGSGYSSFDFSSRLGIPDTECCHVVLDAQGHGFSGAPGKHRDHSYCISVGWWRSRQRQLRRTWLHFLVVPIQAAAEGWSVFGEASCRAISHIRPGGYGIAPVC